MDTYKVYEAFIYVRREGIHNPEMVNYFQTVTLVRCKRKHKEDIYIDINTGQRYPILNENEAEKDVYYINSDPGLIPYTRLVKNVDRHMSKKKILKKYQEIKDRKY